MMVVCVIFAVCWLPFQIYFIVTSYYPEITNSPYIQEVYLGIYWLAMSNSMYNPMIYCWMNSRWVEKIYTTGYRYSWRGVKLLNKPHASWNLFGCGQDDVVCWWAWPFFLQLPSLPLSDENWYLHNFFNIR